MHLTRLLHGKTAARGPGVLALTNPDRHCREALTVVPSAEARPNNHSAADRNFRLHAARRSHPKGLRLEGETYKLQTLHSETTGTSPHFPQTFVEAEIHALRPWSRPKFPQDLPRPNFLHLHPSDQSRGRNFLRQHAEAVFLESVGASQTTSRVSCLATLLTHQLRHVACPA